MVSLLLHVEQGEYRNRPTAMQINWLVSIWWGTLTVYWLTTTTSSQTKRHLSKLFKKCLTPTMHGRYSCLIFILVIWVSKGKFSATEEETASLDSPHSKREPLDSELTRYSTEPLSSHSYCIKFLITNMTYSPRHLTKIQIHIHQHIYSTSLFLVSLYLTFFLRLLSIFLFIF